MIRRGVAGAPTFPRWLQMAAGACTACTAAALPSTALGQRDAPIEEVVVTSSIVETPRRQIGAAVSVVDGGEIELRGYSSMADVLRTQPGIGVTTSGGQGKTTALRIRGEDHYRTLLMIDGVKAIDPSATQAGPVFDSLLTTSDLERVEVLRGPQGFMYGADAGGVVNIMTRRGAGEPHARIGIEQGRYDTTKLDGSLAGGSDKADYFVSVTELETKGFNARTDDVVLRDRDGAENTTLHAKLGWNPTEALRLQLVARDIDAFTEYDGCYAAAPTDDCSGTIEQTTYRISADHAVGALTNRFAYSRIDVTRDNLADGLPSFGGHGELGRFEYTGSYSPTDNATFVYGLDFQDEQMTSEELLERDQRGYYFEYQGAFADRFYLSAGARYDDNEDFGTHTSVRLSTAYVQDLADGSTLKYRASFGTGFRAPSLYEVSYNRGSWAMPPASETDLREERSRGYDVGIEYDTADGFHLELTYFSQRLTDEIYYDLISSSGYLQSTGSSGSRGVEFAARGALNDRWQLYGNWTYNETENTANEQRLRRPRHLANVGVLYAALDDRLRVSANYRVSRDSVDVGNVALDDYGVLDVSATFAVNDRIELHGRLENAADEEYVELLGYHTPGRSLYGGVRLRF